MRLRFILLYTIIKSMVIIESRGDLVLNKNNLLSIGDISKLTKASIQSLRYYEQIHLLEPTYVSPDSGYRYYSFDQKCLIEVIQICIELDIPLKKLTEFMGDDETVNFYDILIHGKEIAEKKLESIKRGLKFIDELKHNVDATEPFENGEMFYSRKMTEKFFCVLPFKGDIEDIDPFEIVKSVLKIHYDVEDYAEMFRFGLVDIGVMSVYTSGKVRHFMFTELPKHIASETGADVKVIPAGTYLCTQSEEKQIEKAAEIFREYIDGRDSFIIFETDIFTKKYKTNKLVHELRFIAANEAFNPSCTTSHPLQSVFSIHPTR